MATNALPQVIPVPGEITFIDTPWQGQGLNVWKALVRNESPYALMIAVSVSTYWLGPYEQDYYEFPEGVYTFGIVPQALGPVPGGSSVGRIIITAFDQSSDYDGNFPVALTPPTLQQTFSLLGTGVLQQGQATPDILSVSGVQGQPFDSLLAVTHLESDATPGIDSPVCYFQFVSELTAFPVRQHPATTDSKGRFSSGGLNFAVPAPGDQWDLTVLTPGSSFVLEYAIFGVTIADTDALLGPPSLLVEATQGNPNDYGPGVTCAFEPSIRGRRGTNLAIDVEYDGALTLQLVTFDEGGGMTVRTLWDDVGPTTNGHFSLLTPDHSAWQLLATNNNDSVGADIVMNVSIVG